MSEFILTMVEDLKSKIDESEGMARLRLQFRLNNLYDRLLDSDLLRPGLSRETIDEHEEEDADD